MGRHRAHWHQSSLCNQHLDTKVVVVTSTGTKAVTATSTLTAAVAPKQSLSPAVAPKQSLPSAVTPKQSLGALGLHCPAQGRVAVRAEWGLVLQASVPCPAVCSLWQRAACCALTFLHPQVFFRGITVNTVRGFPVSSATFLGYELSLKAMKRGQSESSP